MPAWNLRRRILSGYGIVLLLLLVVGIWAVLSIRDLGRASEAILSENYRSILAAEKMINAVERQDSGVLLVALGEDDGGMALFRKNEIEFLQWLGRARDNVTIEGEEAIVMEIDSAYSRLIVAWADLLGSPPATRAAGLEFYQSRVLPHILRARDGSSRLHDMNQATMFAASRKAHLLARRSLWSVGLLGLSALLLGIAFSVILTTILARPIHDLSRAAARITNGDYDVEIPSKTSDELGDLAQQFNTMAGHLRRYRDMNVDRLRTEQRRGEAVIRAIEDGIVVVDAELEIVSLNPSAEQALGVDRSAAVGRPFLEAINDDRLHVLLQEVIVSRHAPEEHDANRFLSREHDGASKHYQCVVTPVFSSSGSLLGAVLLLRDVTALKELDRLKSEFVATASHELRTPLTSIGMSVSLLKERLSDQLGEREAELLDVAHQEVQRLRALVRDLLELSRIEAGKIELLFEPTALPELIETALSNLQPQASEAGLALDLKLEDDLPNAQSDPSKVYWVLSNLLINAIRHTHSGGHIVVRAVRAGHTIQISVADDGEGIPLEYQEKIFEKFVHFGGRRSHEGSGLGLAIAKEIVQAHGGTIWVESQPGHGSTFTFTLPVSD